MRHSTISTALVLLNWFSPGFLASGQELYKVKPLPVNTPDKAEFCAIPFEGGIIFCSDRPDYSPLKFETTKGAKPLVNIFKVSHDSSAEATSEVVFNSVYAHDGPVVFYNNNTRAILTRTQSEKNKLKSLYKDTKLGLYFFEKRDGKWVEIAPFPYNNFTYSCGQAAINEQGNVLIFSSDMPGGNGGTDLYYSTFNEADSGWTLPANMGQIINSSKNEMFPFLHASGTLYYSSSGKKGKGGLDVFHSVGGFPYQRIVHEADDVNSEADDFGFWASPDFSTGYVTSNRLGSDDIFSIKLSYPEFANCVDYEEISFCFEFFEEASLNVDTIPMVYEWDFGDGFKKKSLSAYHCYSLPGIYTVQLNVFDTVINALFMNEAMYELEIKDINQPIMEVPDSANPGVAFNVSADQSRFADFTIAEYYWDFGNGKQLKGQRFPVTIDEAGEYEIILGVASAPDKNGRSQTKCFKKKIIVTNDTIAPLLVDDSRDPAYNKLPGGTMGTSYVVVEDEDGLHVTRVKSDGTTNSNVNTLPNAIFYVKLSENGDTLVKKTSYDEDSKGLLEEYLDRAESPIENKKNGLVTFNAFLPSDSTKYPRFASDIKEFYNPIDSMLQAMNQFTKLPADLARALQFAESDESTLEVINNTRKPVYYNTRPNTDSTIVFYKQLTDNPNKADTTSTSQYATNPYKNQNDNGNTNNTTQNTTKVDTTNNNTPNITKIDTTNTQNTTLNTTRVDTTNNNTQNITKIDTTNTQNTTLNTTKVDTTNNNTPNTTKVDTTNTQNITQNTTKVDTTNTQNTIQNTTKIDTTNTQNTTLNTTRVDTTNNNTQNITKVDTTNTQNTTQHTTKVDTTNTQNTTQNITKVDTTNTQNTTQHTTKVDTTNQTKTNDVDTNAVSVEELLNWSDPDLIYRVQIGAYRFPKNFKYEHLKRLGKFDEQETLGDGITRITMGRFKTLNEAYLFRDKMRSEGVLDTFVTAMYKGKRYYLSELRVILKDVVKPK